MPIFFSSQPPNFQPFLLGTTQCLRNPGNRTSSPTICARLLYAFSPIFRALESCCMLSLALKTSTRDHINGKILCSFTVWATTRITIGYFGPFDFWLSTSEGRPTQQLSRRGGRDGIEKGYLQPLHLSRLFVAFWVIKFIGLGTWKIDSVNIERIFMLDYLKPIETIADVDMDSNSIVRKYQPSQFRSGSLFAWISLFRVCILPLFRA